MLIMPMVFVLLYTFHCEFSQAAEKALSAVGRSYKFRRGRHVRPPAWASHWSHLHERAGGPWGVIGRSGHRRHIALLKGWEEDWHPGLKGKLLLEENPQQGLWQLRGHGVARSMRQTHFSRLARADTLWLSAGLSWSNSLLNWPGAGEGLHGEGLLLGTAEPTPCPYGMCTHKIWHAGCACPPGRDKETFP